jgi:TIR domain-containing protein
MDHDDHVFISYAWGGSLAPKRWLTSVAEQLETYGFKVFIDRSCIAIGDEIRSAIRLRLAERPLTILCMCDTAYCDAAKTPGTGAYDEVEDITPVQAAPGVRIVPIFLEPHSRIQPMLPPLLAGRLGVAMSALMDRKLPIIHPIVILLRGGTQADVQGEADEIVATAELREQLSEAISATFCVIWGDPKQHAVDVDGEELRVGGQLARHRYFVDYLQRNGQDERVQWYWSGCGTGASMLGAAIAGHCFPAAPQGASADLLAAGSRIAEAVFRFIRENEPLCLSPDEVVRALTSDAHSCELARRLLTTSSSDPSEFSDRDSPGTVDKER